MPGPGTDNYKFNLIGTSKAPFVGYVSSEDPTRVSPQALVRGSKNVLLRDTGNIEVRPGIKLYDEADGEQDAVVQSFDWNDKQGNTLLIRVLESGKLQFYNRASDTWYLLEEYDSNAFFFAKWWDDVEKQELLIMCNGTSSLYEWSGAMVDGVGDVDNYNTIAIANTGIVNAISFGSTSNEPVIPFTTAVSNAASATNRKSAIVLDANPTGSSTLLSVTVSSDAPFVSGTFWVQFVDALSTPISDTFSQVLIGPTKEDTVQRLLSLFNDPSANTATQKGFVDSDILTIINDYLTFTAVPSLESATEDTFAEAGFTDRGTIVVGNTTYTYDLVAGRWLVNISGTPDTNDFAYAGVVETTNTPDADFENDFILVLNNQLICCSFMSRIIYISADDDYTDFTNSGDLVPGDPDFAILDEYPTGGITRGSSAYIGGGKSTWYEVTPNTPTTYVASVGATVITEVKKFVGSGLTAPLGANFVTSFGEDIVYLGQDHQLRTLGFYRNFSAQKSPSLSLAVRQELIEEDFTGGCVRAIDEYIYIVAPVSGRTYLYEIKDDVDEVGNITSRKNWQPPQDWNISRLAIVDGIAHGYSAENPQLYQLWDTNQWHDDTSDANTFAPYTCVARFGYRQFADRDDLGSFDKVYYEGYILPNSDLQANVYYDYRGATAIEESVLSSETVNPVLFGNTGVVTIGGDLIGETTIGGGLRDVDYANNLQKFRVITNVEVKDCFEYQIELVSEAPDSRWELIATGANESLSTDEPVNLQLTT